MEGGASNLRFNTKAAGSPTYPFPNMSYLLVIWLATKHQWSRVVLADFLSVLRFKDSESGRGFDINDLDGTQAEHFVARTRDCMPLYEVYKRDVRGSPTAIAAGGDDSTSVVYDIPLNLILDRQFKSSSAMRRFSLNPGGKQLSRAEALASNLASVHIFSGPAERPKGNKRHGNMHGVIARSTPHFGYDGILPTASKERTVHVNDIAVLAAGEADNSTSRTCRVLQKFWDCERNKMMLSVRLFVSVDKVPEDPTGLPHLDACGVRYLRLWEPEGADESVTKEVATVDIEDLCEIYSEAEVKSLQHKMPEWKEGTRSPQVQALPCVGIAFVTRPTDERGGNRKRSTPGGAPVQSNDVQTVRPMVTRGY